jgi:hypothetical protein
MEFIVMDATDMENQTAEDQAGEQSQEQEQIEVDNSNLSDEAKVAAEALALTEEPAEESPEIAGMRKEDERLLGAITAKRAIARELDRKIAEKLAADKAAQPPEKSPYEKYIEEHTDTFDPETDNFPAKIQLEQNKWEKQQAEKQRKKEENASITAIGNKAYIKAREKYKDYDEIVVGAEDLLTEGDQIDINNAARKGEDPAEMLYQRCIYKTLMAGGSRARELRSKLRQKLPSKASAQNQQVKTETGGSEQKSGTPNAPAAPAKTEKLNPALAHIYAAFGRE